MHNTMKRFFIIISMLLIATTSAFAQGQKDLARFYVLKATIDGKDYTSYVVNNDAYTVFYETGDGRLYMANVWEKQDSQSWGPVLNMNSKHHPETSTTYESDEFIFDWAFSNSYDSKTGVCEVSFSKVYKPQGVVSILRIREKSGSVTEYVGYMNGTVNFYKY